jgi:hypothetical protein
MLEDMAFRVGGCVAIKAGKGYVVVVVRRLSERPDAPRGG